MQPGREVPIRQAQLKLPAKGRSVEKPVGEQKLPSDLGYLPTILRSGRKITRNVEDPLAKKLYQATQRPSTLGDGTILTQKIPTSGRSLGPRGRNQTQVLRCSQRLITKKAKSNAQVGLPLNENPLRSAQGLRFNVIGGPSVIPREQRREARLVRLDLSETESEL